MQEKLEKEVLASEKNFCKYFNQSFDKCFIIIILIFFSATSRKSAAWTHSWTRARMPGEQINASDWKGKQGFYFLRHKPTLL